MLLYETFSQPKIFLILVAVGFAVGLFFDLEKYIVELAERNKVITFILDFVLGILICAIFYFTVLNQNYGEIRLYEILAYSSGIFLERKSLGLIIAKIMKWCYTNFSKLLKTIKEKLKKKNDTRKSKNIS